MDEQEVSLLRIQIRDFCEETINEIAKLKAEISGLYRALQECGMTREAIDEIRADSAQDYLSTLNELRKRYGLPKVGQ